MNRSCLDRSNLGEFSISAAMLDKQLAKLGLPPLEGSQLEKAHRELFSEVRRPLFPTRARRPWLMQLTLLHVRRTATPSRTSTPARAP